MVGSKSRNYHRNYGCNLVEIAFHKRSCNTEVAAICELPSMGCSIKWKH